MISHIAGKILYRGVAALVIDVGGVGYNVHVSGEFLGVTREGDSVSVWIHTAMRDSSLDLYGFKDREDLYFFEQLISVSGIGPKSALQILALASVATLKSAILSRDPTCLTKISGIGKKTAQKIIFELQDKIEGTFSSTSPMPTQSDSDAIEVLQTLGYTTTSAREALQKVGENITRTGDRVKEALKQLNSSS